MLIFYYLPTLIALKGLKVGSQQNVKTFAGFKILL